MLPPRRYISISGLTLGALFILYNCIPANSPEIFVSPIDSTTTPQSNSQSNLSLADEPDWYDSSETVTAVLPSATKPDNSKFRWSELPQHYPLYSFTPLPTGDATLLPRIQHVFDSESRKSRATREARRDAVLGNFTHAWRGYKTHAWLEDEVGPLTGKSFNHFGGWAATLVDSLDTLWIMGLIKEFEEAVGAVRNIDFTTCDLEKINIFETTIRYMGGLLGAYDLSDGKYPILLTKAEELGEMIYVAFDTPNRMPLTPWDFMAAKDGDAQIASLSTIVAEMGSLSLELIRLSQLTGEDKFYDAVKRITDVFVDQQQDTHMPGLFPLMVNPQDKDFKTGSMFTLGGMVDSLYEYLPKVHLLMRGATNQSQQLYENAMKPIQEHIIFKPMTIDNRDIRIAGQARVYDDNIQFDPQSQHLTCFTGGMVGLGSRAFNVPEQMKLARQLTDGCTWGYEIMPRGIMPEIMHLVACETTDCSWNASLWHDSVKSRNWNTDEDILDRIKALHLPPGVSKVDDKRYILRPEAIESVFVLYRLTGDSRLQDTAWQMFKAIVAATQTDIAAAGLSDCMDTEEDHKVDRMESFWTAETLKYFYLIFSEPDLVSLDEFVFNTEAHPFRYRPAG